MKMWNNLKMDLYRMVRQKSLYISIGLLIVAFFWMLNAEGLVNNTTFASFDRTKNSVLDFLYFFPKSMFFQLAVLIFSALFFNEEYSSGFVKNIYPVQSKLTLLLEKWIMSIIIILVFTLSCTILSGIELAVHKVSLSGFSIGNYAIYILMNTLLLSAVSCFIMMVNHLVRSKVVTILTAVGYSFTIFFMLNTALCIILPEAVQYVEYTLYYVIGNLNTVPELSAYGKATALAISSGILYNGISYLVLKQKDLA